MLHAAATAAGLSAIWMLWTGQWRSPLELGVAVGAGALAVACTVGAGGSSRLFGSLLTVLASAFGRAGAIIDGLRATSAAVAQGTTRLRPALVRARIGTSRDSVLLAFEISAKPGLVVVDGDEENLLVHADDEDSPEATSLAGLEPTGARL